MKIEIDDHPLLALRAFVTRFDRPLGETASPDWLVDLLRFDATAPLQRSEATRKEIRDLLRHGGYKPTGRGKPASEYLVRAAEQGRLGSINLAVDANNAVSLHSGIPISVLDLDLARAPFRVGIADKGTSYVFNVGGQVIDVSGLLCVFDAEGACGNAVKDAQRTKTTEATTHTLSLLWGSRGCEGQLDAAHEWYRKSLQRAGAVTSDC